METRIERTVKALENKIKEAGCQVFDLTLKANGHNVNIYGDTVYFSNYGFSARFKDLTELAVWLCEYPKKPEEILKAELDYKAKNEPEIQKYYAEHFKGRKWEDIDPEDWSYYSDWHKDVYGYRPHANVCGVYVSPY